MRDGFAHPDGSPNAEMPDMRMVFLFEPTALGSRLTTTTYFGSLDELEQLMAMGMEEGMRTAMEQIDAVVEDLTSFAAAQRTALQLVGARQVRTSRIVRGTVEQVWRAHHDPELVRRWQLGPDGWTMPVCDIATQVGEHYRCGWRNTADGQEFGFTGVLRESVPPHRSVTTEAMWTPDDPEAANSPSTLNELTLTPVDGGTRVTLVITYPDAETRDLVLATGMVDGMEASYARLDAEVLSA